MNLRRSIRKRLISRPARSPEIKAAYLELLGRPPSPSEVAIWEKQWLSTRGLRRAIAKSPEARGPRFSGAGIPKVVQGKTSLPKSLRTLSDEAFVRTSFVHGAGRYPSASDMCSVADALRSGSAERADLLISQFAHRIAEETHWSNSGGDVSQFPVMGKGQLMSVAEWQALCTNPPVRDTVTHSRFATGPRQSDVDVSVICSLWRGGDFIERYLENITSQTIFDDRCELIVIDAASPEGEEKVVARYIERFGDRIVYHRMPYRAGIYVAWNIGVGLARGRFLTNANLDDLRRRDSLEQQAATLDALRHVDVVYQDFLYSAAHDADFEKVRLTGVTSELPLLNPHVMFGMNPPHNAPMWRAELHDRIGLFDESYRSAGDYDFWVRALIDGATFYKLNDPHVVYYHNPEGISTARDRLGTFEARQVLCRHGKALVPEAAVEPPDRFRKRVGVREWPSDEDGPVSRYALVQRCMRDLASRHARSGGRG